MKSGAVKASQGRSPNEAAMWCNAMHGKYNALVKNGTWLLVPRPEGVNMARLVANGSSQQLGVDYDKTFSPVIKPVTIRTPPSFDDARFPNHVCRLHRSLYGLKQAPHARQGSQIAYLLLYVDDIIITTSSIALLQQNIDSLHKEFDMTDLGALNYFLKNSVVRHSTGLFLSQKKYALGLFARAHMVNCNLSRTQGTLELGLHLYASASTSLVGYTDADWAAEYRGVANVVAETAWLHNLLCELHSPLFTATLVYCDNQGNILPFITLVDEADNPLKKVEYLDDYDSEDEVASVDNDMTCSMA
nr:ribonuclease H-like domain-containing protein [Tanacetum cinerariifolium]